MTSINKATDEQVEEFLHQNNVWALKEGKLHREYLFNNFVEAFGFMTQVATIAELHQHHPEWFNVYNKVVVDLTTHEADGITERDFSLAKKIEDIASN